MKTFLLNIPNEIRNWNNTLDAKSVLCNQSWNVFNDEGVKEVYVFQKDGTLIASHNGKVTRAKWEYIPQNTSLIIENSGADTFMLRPAYYDKKVLALQVDGTDNYALMVDEKFLGQLMLDSVEIVRWYIMDQSKYREKIAEKENSEIDKQKKREQEWNKFIDEKIEEYLKTPESFEEIENEKKRNKAVFVIVSILVLVLSFFPIFINRMAGILIWAILIVLLLILKSVLTFKTSDYILEIREKMEKKYPLESFK